MRHPLTICLSRGKKEKPSYQNKTALFLKRKCEQIKQNEKNLFFKIKKLKNARVEITRNDRVGWPKDTFFGLSGAGYHTTSQQ